MGLNRSPNERSPDAIRAAGNPDPRLASGLRGWLFRLCQSRAGQCLDEHTPQPPAQPTSSPPGERAGVRDRASS